jgi:hypothetical protein
MATFAVLDGTLVENCVVADTKATAEEVTGKTCVEYFMVGPGWTYVDGKFEPPAE